MTAFVLALPPSTALTENQFYDLCRANPDIKIERTAQGELILMPPTGGETGQQNFEIAVDFGIWNRQTKLGVAFDSSTCFHLPNGADRSPDIAWVRQDRWNALPPETREKFPPLAPDFVLELMSPSDNLSTTQAKMQEYTANGVQLGWLIDRKAQQVEIYRPGHPVETLTAPPSLSGEEVLPGFVLNLERLWCS